MRFVSENFCAWSTYYVLNSSIDLDIMEELIQDMINAFDNDIESLARGEPGLAKLTLLPRVEEQTSKQTLQDSFIDAGGLGAMREWLRLLPDNSLPNLTLRTSLLQIVKKLQPSITIENLKESKIGQAIRDIIFHEEEIVSNKRLASEIAESWLRQVFGRETGHFVAKATDADMKKVESFKASRSAARQVVIDDEDDEDDVKSKRRTSAIAGLIKHNRDSAPFRVQPVSRVQKSTAAAVGSGASGERIARAVQQRQLRRPAGGTKVSVEGRGLH